MSGRSVLAEINGWRPHWADQGTVTVRVIPAPHPFEWDHCDVCDIEAAARDERRREDEGQCSDPRCCP